MEPREYEAAAAGSPPAAPASPSIGYPTDGNPGTGTPATTPGAFWFYQIAAELRNLISKAGLTPDSTDLTQLEQAIGRLNVLLLAALDYPTIDTSDNRITITPASATNGGTVSIPADVLISLGEEITSGETGVMRNVKTAAYTSADLDVSSTYYLRAKFVSGTWTVYTTKGTDSDTIPASLVGTVDGASGGGFDSTVLDVLIGKIVTSTAGTVPTVTALANAARLEILALEDITTSYTGGWVNLSLITINWARTATIIGTSLAGVTAANTQTATDPVNKAESKISTSNRYSIQAQYDALSTLDAIHVAINTFASA